MAKNLAEARKALRDAESALEDALRREAAFNERQQQRVTELAHEMRTPLNAVIGYAEMLSKEMIGPIGRPEYKEYAGTIEAAAAHLLGVCDSVLKGMGRRPEDEAVEAETVDAGAVINDVVAMFGHLAEERGVELVSHIEDDFPTLKTDGTRLKRILVNLVSNAVKFTQRGGNVEVVARFDDTEGAMILVVQDNGKGMSRQEMVDALKPYKRRDSESPHGDMGFGMGLPIVEKLIGDIRGRISLSSRQGEGTIVAVKLPLSINGENAASGPSVTIDDFTPIGWTGE